ncbi:conserved hypothetical protein [Neospora caninum Liverpool]|uniref:Uncharacterized protein n=1 Tax=Neospora caninum (strain Liverpool) TaxID=572307 RepID=F0VBT1_NEOCL|nr:conserved hypothetical protein [Neospora caninum Liverpool]CBZ51065.1 conserved hypothetical protein [Neospora caninum Liverpool]CEL68372.1 TPA: hypothetical protein BN1204_041400 [Neospora caninum Liverpool]|eukprot:XP_003881098.1 conserved hypothetical protein [Neospora caninum Liverpool]
MQEQAEAFSQQLQQQERTSKRKLQEALEALDRQAQLSQKAESELLRQKRDHEEKMDRVMGEAEAKIRQLETEKRRAAEDAAQEVLALKQEEHRNATEIETLQEQCQHLAIQHAKSLAKAEQLAKQAEGVQADCERRLNEHNRLLADFRALEETHRGLLMDTESLSRSKEEAETIVVELRGQLAEREKRIEQHRMENAALQQEIKEKEAAREDTKLQLQKAAAEVAQLKRVACSKLSSARRKEERLRRNIHMLVDRVNQVMAERNGLWQALLKVKDDYDVHAKQIESQAAARLSLPLSTLAPSMTEPHSFSSSGHATTAQIPSRSTSLLQSELQSHSQPSSGPVTVLSPFFSIPGDYTGGGTCREGGSQEGPQPTTSVDSASVFAPAAGGAACMPVWGPSSTPLSLNGEKTGNIISSSSAVDGMLASPTGGLGFFDSVLGGLNQNDSKGIPLQGCV